MLSRKALGIFNGIILDLMRLRLPPDPEDLVVSSAPFSPVPPIVPVP